MLKNKVGVGLMVNHDEIGSYKNEHIYGYYAYKIHFQEATLSMGPRPDSIFSARTSASWIYRTPRTHRSTASLTR